MILVHLAHTWPQVLAGTRTAAEVTLGDWTKISDAAIAEYGDVVAGIYKNEVVAAFDCNGFVRAPDGKVRFTGPPSKKWAHLVGTPNPGRPWVRGQARPIQYVDTDTLEYGDTDVEDTRAGRRAVVDGITLAVDEAGAATVLLPAGRSLTVVSVATP